MYFLDPGPILFCELEIESDLIESSSTTFGIKITANISFLFIGRFESTRVKVSGQRFKGRFKNIYAS